MASAWKSADCGRGAGGALSWADGGKTGGVVTLLLSQQGHTHTDAFTYGTPTQETLEQRFVIVFHFDGGVLLLLEISRVSLLLSSSESVRLEVQQTPLTMVTDRSSFSNCPQAIYEELLSN